MSEEQERTRRAVRVKQLHEPALLAKANVLGVGVGLRQRSGKRGTDVAVVVLVRRKVPASQLAPQDRIPSEIDGDISDEILEIGRISGTAAAALGMAVRKSGRTTGLTTGQVTVLETTVDVDYGGKTARFEGQILSGPMSQPGDSGSLLVAASSLQAIGLLFAGSSQVTIYNPIGDVLQALAVVLP